MPIRAAVHLSICGPPRRTCASASGGRSWGRGSPETASELATGASEGRIARSCPRAGPNLPTSTGTVGVR
eukprot:2014241-Alexandrium_andersonii.AAC.1